MDYDILNLGVACAGKEGFEICYEAAREDFFENISGEDIITEKKGIQKTPSKSKFKTILAEIKKNKKKILFILAGLTTLSLAIVALKKRASADSDEQRRLAYIEKTEKEINRLKAEAENAKKTAESYDEQISEFVNLLSDIEDKIYDLDTEEKQHEEAKKHESEMKKLTDKIAKAEKLSETWYDKVRSLREKISNLEIKYTMCKKQFDGYKSYV